METVQRCKHEHMPGKERKRKWGVETAAHNCVEIEGSLYVITHIKRFRLGHGIELQWAIIQSQAWLRLQCLFNVLQWPMRIFIAFPGRPEITSDLQSPGVPPAD